MKHRKQTQEKANIKHRIYN